MTTYKAIRGFNDVLPGETEKWQFIESMARQVFHCFGFSEIKVPIVEKAELFKRSIGETTDIVEKEMYTFPDRKDELLTLRPEGTASVARAYVQHQLHTQSALSKLYYIGPMFRYERPQKGRSRQFYQIGAEAIGLSSPAIDAEVISMLFTFFGKVGLADLKLNINSIGCRECRPIYKTALLEFLSNKADHFCDNCTRRYRDNPLRVLDCKSTHCSELTKDAPSILDHLCTGCSDDFEKLKQYLDLLGLAYHINPRMVRGLDYYTKTAFEITSTNLGSQDAVAAGGRYDRLIEEVGGPPSPAIGFAIGIERLAMLVPEDQSGWKSTPQLYVAALGEDAFETAFRLSNDVRKQGFKVELNHEGKSLKAQMKKANSMGAEYVLILGEDELKSGKANLKEMKSHDQVEIAWENIGAEMKARIK